MSEVTRRQQQVARYGSAGSIKRRTRQALRRMRGARTVSDGLTPLDLAFGLPSAIVLLAFGVGMDGFNEDERRRRRARGKRQRAARRAGRKHV